NQSGEIRERFGIDGERPIPVLIVDVEIDDVGRDPVIAKTRSDFPDLRLRSVTVARLLETQRPERGERRFPGEISVGFHDLLRRGAVNEVVVERAAFGAEGNRIARLLAEIEPGAPGVVEKNPVAARSVNREEKGDGLVQRVDRFLRTDV